MKLKTLINGQLPYYVNNKGFAVKTNADGTFTHLGTKGFIAGNLVITAFFALAVYAGYLEGVKTAVSNEDDHRMDIHQAQHKSFSAGWEDGRKELTKRVNDTHVPLSAALENELYVRGLKVVER